MAAVAAPPAENLHRGHHGADRRQIDVIVAMATALLCGGHVRPAMSVGAGHPPLGLVGRLGLRTVPACSRRSFLRRPLGPFGSPGAILRRRRMGVGGGLPRLAHDRLRLGDQVREALDHLRLLQQQGVLLGLSRAKSGLQSHPYFDSYPQAARTPRRYAREQLRGTGRPPGTPSLRSPQRSYAARSSPAVYRRLPAWQIQSEIQRQ